jgi:hypothetical protein
MKIISVVGPTQSGSTLLFNLLRFILEKDYIIDSCWISDFKLKKFNRQCDYLIVKAHGYDEYLKNSSQYIFLPVRDVRDSAISRAKRDGYKSEKFKSGNRKWNILAFKNNMNHNIDLINKWKSYTTYIFKYEDYMLSKEKMLGALCNNINRSLTKADIENIILQSEQLHNSKKIVEFDNPDNEFYKKTLISQNHNSSGGKMGKYEVFFSEKILKIFNQDSKIKDFLTEYKYL